MKPFEKYVKIEEERYLKLLENEEENKKLNELVQFNVKTTATLTKRINKAIEYIEEYKDEGMGEQWFRSSTPVSSLLKILKGEE